MSDAMIDTNAAALAAMAGDTETRGGAGDVLEHFRRARGSHGSEVPDNIYDNIVAVYRCVNFIADKIASMPFCVSTRDDRVVEDGPIIDLLENPNPWMSGEDFWRESTGWALLGGRTHWIFPVMSGGVPRQALPTGRQQVRPIMQRYGSTTGRPIAWEYRQPGERWDQAQRLDLDQVWTIRFGGYDPDRPYNGTAAIDVVRKAISQIYKADIANEAALINGVQPGGALVTKSELTLPQKRDLRDELTDRQGGPHNNRKPLILFGDWTWEEISSSFADMEFAKLKLMSRADICSAFGLDDAAVFRPRVGAQPSTLTARRSRPGWTQ